MDGKGIEGLQAEGGGAKEGMREGDRPADKQTHNHTERLANRYTDRQVGRHTDRQIYEKTETRRDIFTKKGEMQKWTVGKTKRVTERNGNVN